MPNYTELEHSKLKTDISYEMYIQKNMQDILKKPTNTLFSDYGAPLHSPEATKLKYMCMFSINEITRTCIEDVKNYIKESVPFLALDMLWRTHFKSSPIQTEKSISDELFWPETLTEYYIYKNYIEGRYRGRSASYSKIELQWFHSIDKY